MARRRRGAAGYGRVTTAVEQALGMRSTCRPTTLPRERVGLRHAARRVARPAPLARRDEVRGRVGDAHQALLAVGSDDVADRGRHDRLAGGQVLRRLGRADERVASLRANGSSATSQPAM